MSLFGITNFNGYLPANFMPRAAIVDAIGWVKPALKGYRKGNKRFAAWDEDPITLSVGAARPLLENPHFKPDSLCFASTTAPFIDRQNSGVIAAALDLPESTHCFEMSGSQRAAVSALITLANSKDKSALLVAAEQRKTQSGSVLEMLSGDGGAALALGTENVVAEIVTAHSVYADFVDHYRSQNSASDYMLEDRWFRDEGLLKIVPKAVAPLFKEAGIIAEDISHLIVPVPVPRMALAVAKTLGIGANAIANSLFEECGHTGAAHAILMLVGVLENAKPNEWILLCGFGQGCDAVLFRTTKHLKPSSALKDQINAGHTEENYTRFLAAHGKLDIDWGMRAERDNRTAQSVAYNKSRDIYGFVGGQCETCGTPQFPKSRRCVNPQCGALDTQKDYRFAEISGKVKSFTEDWLAFTRSPPLVYGNVNFEGGGNIFLEMTGFRPGDIKIGTKVLPAFRIKDIDHSRGFHRYFWKAAPAQEAANG